MTSTPDSKVNSYVIVRNLTIFYSEQTVETEITIPEISLKKQELLLRKVGYSMYDAPTELFYTRHNRTLVGYSVTTRFDVKSVFKLT